GQLEWTIVVAHRVPAVRPREAVVGERERRVDPRRTLEVVRRIDVLAGAKLRLSLEVLLERREGAGGDRGEACELGYGLVATPDEQPRRQRIDQLEHCACGALRADPRRDRLAGARVVERGADIH